MFAYARNPFLLLLGVALSFRGGVAAGSGAPSSSSITFLKRPFRWRSCTTSLVCKRCCFALLRKRPRTSSGSLQNSFHAIEPLMLWRVLAFILPRAFLFCSMAMPAMFQPGGGALGPLLGSSLATVSSLRRRRRCWWRHRTARRRRRPSEARSGWRLLRRRQGWLLSRGCSLAHILFFHRYLYQWSIYAIVS